MFLLKEKRKKRKRKIIVCQIGNNDKASSRVTVYEKFENERDNNTDPGSIVQRQSLLVRYFSGFIEISSRSR